MSSRIESLSRGLNSGGCATNKCSAFLGGACGFLHTPPGPATEPRCTRHGWAQRELASPRGDQPDMVVMSCRRSAINPRTPPRAPVAAATQASTSQLPLLNSVPIHANTNFLHK